MTRIPAVADGMMTPSALPPATVLTTVTGRVRAVAVPCVVPAADTAVLTPYDTKPPVELNLMTPVSMTSINGIPLVSFTENRVPVAESEMLNS